MKNLNRVLWGIVLVAIGVIWALKSFGLEVEIFFDGWWTLFIIVPCAIGLVTQRDKTANLMGIAVGVLLLLASRDIISFSVLWQLALPIAVVIVGLKMIFGGMFRKKGDTIKEEMKREGKRPQIHCAAFSGRNVGYDGQAFEGAELTAVFGGVECDLRNAVLDRDCVIDVCAVFGGIDIFLPDHVNVKIGTTSIFGGVSDKRGGNKKESTVTVYIQGIALFGGVDVK